MSAEHFLEGMDIRDPEFEEWLTIERQVWQERLAARKASDGKVSEFSTQPPGNGQDEIGKSGRDHDQHLGGSGESDPGARGDNGDEWVFSFTIQAAGESFTVDLVAPGAIDQLHGATLTVHRRPARKEKPKASGNS